MNVWLLFLMVMAWSIPFLMLAGYVCVDWAEHRQTRIVAPPVWRDLVFCAIWPVLVVIFIARSMRRG